MMILKQGERIQQPKRPIDMVDSMYIELGNQTQQSLLRVTFAEIMRFVNDNNKPGKPAYYNFEHGMLMVYPRPDKNYRAKVFGARRVML